MLVKVTVGQSALRDETALEMGILVVHQANQILVIQADGLLLELLDLVRLRRELLNSVVELGQVNLGAVLRDEIDQVVAIGPQLHGVILDVDGQDLIVGEVEHEQGEVLADGGVLQEARVAKLGHPVVRVVVAVVVPDGVAGAIVRANVGLRVTGQFSILLLGRKVKCMRASSHARIS